MIKSDKVNVIYEDDAVINNSELIRSLADKYLIVCGKSSARKSGALDDVLEVLRDKEYVI